MQATPVSELQWQKFIVDPSLQKVIDLALENNRDLRIASLNVEKAGAAYRIQRSELVPAVVAGASGQRNRTGSRLSDSGEATTSQEYAVGVGFTSWELDLFGRIRSLKERALEQFFATESARSGVQVALIAGVSNAYLALAADRENLALAKATMDTQHATYDLIRQSYELGVASELDMLQARSQMEAATVQMSRYAGLVETDIHALDLIVGTTVPDELLPRSLADVEEPRAIDPGLSSDVLLERPDIRIAENQLKAANASIGAARAAYFPRITLTTFIGTISDELDGLFKSGTGGWSFAPQVTVPLFDLGARRANLAVAKADRDIAVAGYEQAIQSAFREARDALALKKHLADQVDAQQKLVETLRQAYTLSNARYEQGIDGYLPVLIAQRAYYAAQNGLVQLQLIQLANRIELFKVLGGGQ